MCQTSSTYLDVNAKNHYCGLDVLYQHHHYYVMIIKCLSNAYFCVVFIISPHNFIITVSTKIKIKGDRERRNYIVTKSI